MFNNLLEDPIAITMLLLGISLFIFFIKNNNIRKDSNFSSKMFLSIFLIIFPFFVTFVQNSEIDNQQYILLSEKDCISTNHNIKNSIKYYFKKNNKISIKEFSKIMAKNKECIEDNRKLRSLKNTEEQNNKVESIKKGFLKYDALISTKENK